MASYTITGHPLNYADLADTPGAAVDPDLLAALRDNGVGATVTVALSTGEASEAESLGIIE